MKINISEHDDGRRLDKVLRVKFPEIALSNIFKMLRKGDIKVNGKKSKQDYRLKEGDEISIPATTSNENKEQKRVKTLPFNIIFEDENILAIDKPEGLATQGGSKVRQSVDALVKNYYQDSDFPPQIVHRLDKDTSGVLILAKNGKALREIQRLFKEREVEKFYTAIAKGIPAELEGEINIPLTRTDSNKKVIKDSLGQEAKTNFEILESDIETSLLRIQIFTGRMHQIRVHLAEIGHPVLGDEKYGDFKWNKERKAKRLYLHSTKIKFELFGRQYKIEQKVKWNYK